MIDPCNDQYHRSERSDSIIQPGNTPKPNVILLETREGSEHTDHNEGSRSCLDSGKRGIIGHVDGSSKPIERSEGPDQTRAGHSGDRLRRTLGPARTRPRGEDPVRRS